MWALLHNSLVSRPRPWKHPAQTLTTWNNRVSLWTWGSLARLEHEPITPTVSVSGIGITGIHPTTPGFFTWVLGVQLRCSGLCLTSPTQLFPALVLCILNQFIRRLLGSLKFETMILSSGYCNICKLFLIKNCFFLNGLGYGRVG